MIRALPPSNLAGIVNEKAIFSLSIPQNSFRVLPPLYGGRSSMVEPLIVVQAVAGSSPVGRPPLPSPPLLMSVWRRT